MKRRELGNSGIEVAPLALGGNVFGWTIDAAQSFQILDAFVGYGLNLVDTANMYSTWVPGHQGGESETIIGDWFQRSGKRDSVVLATKVGMKMGDGSEGLKKDYILRSAEDSLRRLKTDRIDLYQSHADDATTPLDETLSAYETLLQQGKVLAIGASNYSGDRLKEALRVSKSRGYPSYVTLQPEYNLYDRERFETELEPICLEYNVSVINYYSLASGFLTGKYREKKDLAVSARGQGVGDKYLNERGFKILQALDDVAAAQNTSQAAVALAWLIQRESVAAPIASATSLDQLEQIVQSLRISLTEEQVDLLDVASAYGSNVR